MNKNLVATTFYIPHIEQTVRGLKENKVKKEIYAIKQLNLHLKKDIWRMVDSNLVGRIALDFKFNAFKFNHSATPSCLRAEFVSSY